MSMHNNFFTTLFSFPHLPLIRFSHFYSTKNITKTNFKSNLLITKINKQSGVEITFGSVNFPKNSAGFKCQYSPSFLTQWLTLYAHSPAENKTLF